VIEALNERRVPLNCAIRRFPLQAQQMDLAKAGLVIALDEQEHRPYLVARLPGWETRVEYWHVHDLGLVPAQTALAQIERATRELVRRLQR
jgi:protein-tyrosine phosphatase